MKSGRKPEAQMSLYKLSNKAKQDLINIAKYGDEHFGIKRSNQYRDQLKNRFITISKQPLLYPAVNHIRKGYRRSVCGVNSIYYTIDNQKTIIQRVLGKQDTSHI